MPSLVMITCGSLSRSSSVEGYIGILVNLLILLKGMIHQSGVTICCLWPWIAED